MVDMNKIVKVAEYRKKINKPCVWSAKHYVLNLLAIMEGFVGEKEHFGCTTRGSFWFRTYITYIFPNCFV